MIREELFETEYERGFRHGENKTIPLKRKLDQCQTERNKWKQRYQSQVPQLRDLVQKLRVIVGDEVFHQVCTKPNRWHFEDRKDRSFKP